MLNKYKMNLREQVQVNGTVEVYSYKTLMLKCISGIWYENKTWYSATTSKHINYYKKEKGITETTLLC